MSSSQLVIIPVYNEEQHLEGLLQRLREVYLGDVIFIDDGSADCSPCVLGKLEGDAVKVVRHSTNRGYGATLLRGYAEAICGGYEYAITMDSDGQHKPEWIPEFFEVVKDWDIVSGSRYLVEEVGNGQAPVERRTINKQITQWLNQSCGFSLTDAFCGFKAYRVAALTKFNITETGYAMPLQFWVQSYKLGLRITERPVSRIYDDPNRRFGNGLDDPEVRLRYYKQVLQDEFAKVDANSACSCPF